MKSTLRELGPGSPAAVHVLQEPGPVVVGRGRECEIRLCDKSISREHSVLTFHAGHWQIKDLGSTNGTKVNDRRVATATLTDGDIVSVGRVRLLFHAATHKHRQAATTQDFSLANANRMPEPGGDFGKRRVDPTEQQTAEIQTITPAQIPASRPFMLARRYELGELIHEGSTGTFVKARDAKSDRIVCIKMLADRIAKDEAELKRFVRGVQTAARLQHPNVVQLYRAGQSRLREQWWLAMEFVDGPSLRQVIARYGIGNMLAPAKVLSIACDITAALEVAFEKQVLHRNIRPENILLSKSGTAKLSDFSLTRGVVLTTLQRITGSNELVGDLAYMAPERTEPDGQVDCRADIYALGACLYTLLAGRPPFTGRGTVDLIERVRHDAPRPPGRFNLSVPGPFEGVVMKCLTKSPSDRFQTPFELRNELVRVARFQGMWT